MPTKLTNDDLDFLTELVADEVTRVVKAVVEQAMAQVKVEVAQTFVNLAVQQLETFGVRITPTNPDGTPAEPPHPQTRDDIAEPAISFNGQGEDQP